MYSSNPGYQGQPYGGYQNPATISPEVMQWFTAVDRDQSGKIDAKELQAALATGQGRKFSDLACQLMVGMFDKDKSGTVDINEFQQLYNYINQWLSVFRTYDRDQSGFIEELELSQGYLIVIYNFLLTSASFVALQQMGFKFSDSFIKLLIAKSDLPNHQKMSVDQFIVVCVQIQRFTEAFRLRDREMKGVILIEFEDFLKVALECSV